MDRTFNLFKVRFAILDELFSKNCQYITKDSRINVFINMEPILRKLLSITNEDYSRVSKINLKEFTSNIINIAAHYRLFFSKHKLYSRIYVYIPTPQSAYINTSFIEEYRQLYYHNMTKNAKYKNLGNIISDSQEIVQLISEYIEGVYFIESGSIENSLIPYIINSENNDNFHNFIVSNDPYDFQYVNMGFDIIVPRKEKSFIVNKENIIKRLKEKEGVDTELEPSSMVYSFILSIMGDKRRNIPKISRMGLTTILKTIDKAVANNIITDKTFNINLLSSIVREDYTSILLNNFYATDIKSQFNRLGQYDIYFITKQIKDKYDEESLKKINDLYFSETPIMLLEACSGTRFKEVEKATDIFNLRK